MAKPEMSSIQDAVSDVRTEPDSAHKHRKHGYRGYPNHPRTGQIHWGSGFSGIGSMRGPVGSSGILTERTRSDAAHTDDEDTLEP